jgi:biotin synthase-like enzyme
MMKKYKIKNKQRVADNFKLWEQNNPDKLRQYGRNHRAKSHKITDIEWQDCKQYFNYECAYCGMTEEEHKEKYKQQLHKEHVIYNGANDLSNCVPSCRTCNSEKHTTDWNLWYNENNPKYSQQRYDKITKWLECDYKKYIKQQNDKIA